VIVSEQKGIPESNLVSEFPVLEWYNRCNMDRIHLKPFFNCESRTDEYDLVAFLRKHSRSYVDAENKPSVPSGRVAAERVV
jgi:hypothetical protein